MVAAWAGGGLSSSTLPAAWLCAALLPRLRRALGPSCKLCDVGAQIGTRTGAEVRRSDVQVGVHLVWLGLLTLGHLSEVSEAASWQDRAEDLAVTGLMRQHEADNLSLRDCQETRWS